MQMALIKKAALKSGLTNIHPLLQVLPGLFDPAVHAIGMGSNAGIYLKPAKEGIRIGAPLTSQGFERQIIPEIAAKERLEILYILWITRLLALWPAHPPENLPDQLNKQVLFFQQMDVTIHQSFCDCAILIVYNGII